MPQQSWPLDERRESAVFRTSEPAPRLACDRATFRCGRQGCGSTEVRVYSCFDQEEGEMFLAGDPPEAYREIPEKASRE
jgi:hypothetical protein